MLKVGGTGLLGGLSLPLFLQLRAEAALPVVAKAKACIFFMLEGGPSHIDMWDLKPEAPAEIRGSFRPIRTSVPGIEICEHLPRLAGMMEKLVVYPERMNANLESLGGVVHSGEVLLALTKSGILREDAYRIVQSCAMETWTKLGTPQGRSFRQNLEADPAVAQRVSKDTLDAAMDSAIHTKHVDRIFERVFGRA